MRRNKSLIRTKQTNKKRLWGWWFSSIGIMPPLGSILPPQKSGTGVYALNAINWGIGGRAIRTSRSWMFASIALKRILKCENLNTNLEIWSQLFTRQLWICYSERSFIYSNFEFTWKFLYHQVMIVAKSLRKWCSVSLIPRLFFLFWKQRISTKNIT